LLIDAVQISRLTEGKQMLSFTDEREPRRRIAPKALARFKERVREQTQRTRGISLTQMVKDLTTYLRGWLGYFGDCQTPSVLHSLETWLRPPTPVGGVEAMEARTDKISRASQTGRQ
jgi:hypothetical protein